MMFADEAKTAIRAIMNLQDAEDARHAAEVKALQDALVLKSAALHGMDQRMAEWHRDVERLRDQWRDLGIWISTSAIPEQVIRNGQSDAYATGLNACYAKMRELEGQ